MNGLMHPEDVLDYSRKHHNEILKLVEIERKVKPIPEKRLGLFDGILLGMGNLVRVLRSKLRPKKAEIVCRSTCDQTSGCVV